MRNISTQRLVLLALLTAIVIVLQLLGALIRFGPFSISLVLMPIAVGAALIGTNGGGWLGLVFGIVVLLSGDAAPFFAINPAGTVITVLIKGMFAGLAAGAAYSTLSKKNKTIGAVSAAVVCPLVNTGLFIACSYIFFLDTLSEWGMADGFVSVTSYIFLGMVGVNFLVELGINILLCPVIIRLIQYGQKTLKKAT